MKSRSIPHPCHGGLRSAVQHNNHRVYTYNRYNSNLIRNIFICVVKKNENAHFITWRRFKLLFQFVHVLVSSRWIRLVRLRFTFYLQPFPPQLRWTSRLRALEWAKHDRCKWLQCTLRQDNPSSSPPLTVFRGHEASPLNGRRCNIKQAAIVPRLAPMLLSEEILASLASGTSSGSGWYRLNPWAKQLVTEIFFSHCSTFCLSIDVKRKVKENLAARLPLARVPKISIFVKRAVTTLC